MDCLGLEQTDEKIDFFWVATSLGKAMCTLSTNLGFPWVSTGAFRF
jgi:hypothetical protein